MDSVRRSTPVGWDTWDSVSEGRKSQQLTVYSRQQLTARSQRFLHTQRTRTAHAPHTNVQRPPHLFPLPSSSLPLRPSLARSHHPSPSSSTQSLQRETKGFNLWARGVRSAKALRVALKIRDRDASTALPTASPTVAPTVAPTDASKAPRRTEPTDLAERIADVMATDIEAVRGDVTKLGKKKKPKSMPKDIMNGSVVPRAVAAAGAGGAGGAGGSGGSSASRKVCTMCGAEFPSRSKLMKHLHEEGVHGSGVVPMRTEVDFNAAFLSKHGFNRGRPLAGRLESTCSPRAYLKKKKKKS